MLSETKRIIKHLAVMLGIAIGLVLIVLLIIHFYTGHGKANALVPQIEGLRIDEAVQLIEKQGFKYQIIDTVYRDGEELLTIIDQNPEPNSEVKPGRMIYLVLNTDKIPLVAVPALAGKTSFKEARRILKIKGLELGKIIERPDPSVMDPNSKPVLDQLMSGDTLSLKPGTKIKRHSSIDLVIGVMMEQDEEDEGFEEGEPEIPED